MKTGIKIVLALLLLQVGSTWIYAQPGLPGDPAQAPLGHGLLLLMLAGLALAIRSLLKKGR